MPRTRHLRRFTHYLRPNRKTHVPTERVYLDCEAQISPLRANKTRHTLSFGWACYERSRTKHPGEIVTEEWQRFTTPLLAWQWLTAHTLRGRRLVVYAHNLAYDAALLALQSMAHATGWELVDYVTADHLLWVELRRDGATICFLDTLNYFSGSLAHLGASIGLPKLPMPRSVDTAEVWDTYCRRDVEIVRKLMQSYFALISEADLGHYHRTIGAQAFATWRHRFMERKPLIMDDSELCAFERQSYHGGRTEVFYDREVVGQTSALDINQAFAAEMSRHLYPIRKIVDGASTTHAKLTRMLERGCVIAEVQLCTDEPVYAYGLRERVIYPIGMFTVTLTTRELRYALAHGHILSIGRWVFYEDALLFREYARTLHRLRWQYKDAGNPAFAELCKRLNNSLYGKFGQRGHRWELCSDAEIGGIWESFGECSASEQPLMHRKRFGAWQHEWRDLEALESFPAIAAHITADARLRLWELIKLAGREHVYYVDTDSLYTDAVGKERLAAEIDPRILGALKLEGEYQSVHFRAPKDYRLNGELHIKSVRDSAWEVRDGYYVQEQFESYDQVLARGDDGAIVVTTVSKRISRTNHQSTGENVGWRQPLRLQE